MGLRSRIGVGAVTAVAALVGIPTLSNADEFPPVDRAYCDSGPPPDTYWGAREARGDLNEVSAGFQETAGPSFGVRVLNTGTDRHGVPFSSDTQCSRSINGWLVFEANLGLEADSLSLDGVAPHGPVPAEIVAEASMGPGPDEATGHDGSDRFDGGAGADKLLTGVGKDRLTGGSGRDKLNAGGSKDRLDAVDGARDKVRCGGGNDRAKVDDKDQVADDCERVKTV